jgi:hypothetical protein
VADEELNFTFTSPLACPTCGATNQAGDACRRCRSDLRLLQRLEADRVAESHVLARALATGQWSEALLAAQYIHTLRQDDVSFRLLGVCQLLSGQLESARATYQQHRTATNPSSSSNKTLT